MLLRLWWNAERSIADCGQAYPLCNRGVERLRLAKFSSQQRWTTTSNYRQRAFLIKRQTTQRMMRNRMMKTMAALTGRNSRAVFHGWLTRSVLTSCVSSSGSSNRPFIPKRGEKEYEPSGQSGTLLQQHRLERGRSAMFAALDVERTVSKCVANFD